MLIEDSGDEPAKSTASQPPSREIDNAERMLSTFEPLEPNVKIKPGGGTCRSETGDGELLQKQALEILALRRRRHSVFGKAMFGEPAWEMLLLLYGLGIRQTVTRLAEHACASKSTSIRWIDYLEAQRLVAREQHPTDKRVVYVDLTEKGRERIRLYLSGSTAKRD